MSRKIPPPDRSAAICLSYTNSLFKYTVYLQTSEVSKTSEVPY